jgi:hypothetical protein
MTSLKRAARLAGLWYLGFFLGPFYLIYVPSHTMIHNDAEATASSVLAHEVLFRWGMLTETVGAVVFIGLGLALYRLFGEVDHHRARQMVALVLVSSALGLVAVLFDAAGLLVFRTGDGFAGFDIHARNAIGMLLLRMHGQANAINQMFWGLWLLPFGCLVVRSRFLPQWLGYWLIVDGIAWVVLSVTWFLAPAYSDVLLRYFQPIFLCERVVLVWLLVGVRDRPAAAAAAT